MNDVEPKTAKGGKIRALFLETAMQPFQEQGCGTTIVRAGAAEAGSSSGDAHQRFAGGELRRRSSRASLAVFASSVGECGRRDF